MASGLVARYPVLEFLHWGPAMWVSVPPRQTVLLPEFWHHTPPWINLWWPHPLPWPSALALSYILILRTFPQGRPMLLASGGASWPQEHSVAPSRLPLVSHPFVTSYAGEMRGCLCNNLLWPAESEELPVSGGQEGSLEEDIAKYHIIGSNFRILTLSTLI